MIVSRISSLSQNNQDCKSAIPVCQGIYTQVNSYTGFGDIEEKFPFNSCILGSEKNSVWYVITVIQDGLLGFELTPNILQNDYDWQVVNLTNITCDEISLAENKNYLVSCNYSNTKGVTGATGASASMSQKNVGTPFNALIPVLAGESYTIMISNFTSDSLGQSGYTLNFVKYSTAVILDNIPPIITGVNRFSDCKIDSLEVNFSENVTCSSVEIQDFLLTTPTNATRVPSAISSKCSNGDSFDKRFVLYFNPPLLGDGQYKVEVVGTMADLCNNVTTGNFAFDFELLSIGLNAVAEKSLLCYGDSTKINFSTVFGIGNLTYTIDPLEGIFGDIASGNLIAYPTVSTNYTIIAEDQAGCSSTRIVPITVNPRLEITTLESDTICSGIAFTVATTVVGGKPPYTFLWEPPLEISNSFIQEPTVNPTVNRKYVVTVTDSSGCFSSDSVEFFVRGIGVLTISNVDTISICECDSFKLDAGSNFDTFVWSPSNETSQIIYPKVSGKYFVEAIASNGCKAISNTIDVVVQQSNTIISVVTPNTATIGDTIDIIATITSSNSGECIKPLTLNGTFEVNSSVLFPLTVESNGIVTSGQRLLPVVDVLGVGNIQKSYRYIVTLGDEEVIRFKTNSFTVSECLYSVAAVDEIVIPITDICFEGGAPRLFLSGSTNVGIMSVSPNPSSENATVRYQIRENGITLLKVYSLLGNEVGTIVQQFQIPGVYEIDMKTNNLSTGKYILQLVTPTKTQTHSFEVIR